MNSMGWKVLVGTLTRLQLKAYMGRPSLRRRLIVTPLLDPEKQIGIAGIDLRLNNQFIVFRGRALRAFDPGEPNRVGRFFERHPCLSHFKQLREFSASQSEELLGLVRRYQEKVVVPFNTEFVLHPGELVLGSSFEYVAIPQDLEGQVEGRSSWARLGLVVASASTVEPGFKGVVTLELNNFGTQPLVLWPGTRVACLVLHTTEGAARYTGMKYVCPIGPEVSKVHMDRDMERWIGMSNIEVLAEKLAAELLGVRDQRDHLRHDAEDDQKRR